MDFSLFIRCLNSLPGLLFQLLTGIVWPGDTFSVIQSGPQMDTVGEKGVTPDALLQDSPNQISAAARRVLDSEGLRRSDKLRELLAYLLKRAANCPDSPVREQNIGAEVYRRKPNYDTNHDTVVRVQIAPLRKKLERYYQTEGADEELILTYSKGKVCGIVAAQGY